MIGGGVPSSVPLTSASSAAPAAEAMMSTALGRAALSASPAATLVLAETDGGTSPAVAVTDENGLTRELVPADPDDFEMLAAAQAEASDGQDPVTPHQLAQVAQNGHVVVLRDESGILIGWAQVLLASTDAVDLAEDEAHCYGSFVVGEFQGCGHLDVLHRAQEKLARAAGKTHLTVSERADSVVELTERLRAGFRVVDYCCSDHRNDGAGATRLLLHKSLRIDGEPFAEDEHWERVAQGLATRTPARDIITVAGTAEEIALDLGPSRPDGWTPQQGDVEWIDARRRTEISRAAEVLIDAGYVGVGRARGNSRSSDGAFVYRRPRLSPTRMPGPPSVRDEHSRMREVVVNYDSFVADITPEDAINQVAARNIGRVDALGHLDEYREFVAALDREGVRVIRSGARGANGRFACFARDTAFVAGETAFIAHMARRQRQPESKAMSHLFRSRQHVDVRRHHEAYLEGGDVLLERPNRIIVGIGQRTNDAGVDALRAALPDFEVVRVRHADLHLDVLFTIVGERIALVHKPGLPADFLRWLEAQRYVLVSCDPDEQRTLGCNVLAVDNRRVIAAAENVKTNAALAKHVDVIPVKMRNIVMDGGGPRCMACPVRRDSARPSPR
jgi:N-dimethylarginine dimethylaminohydrolase